MTDERQAQLAEDFHAARQRLVRVAYSILGSRAEAEDAVADCWLRLVTAGQREPVEDVLAWSTVAVARISLDVLKSARISRRSYVGPWLPEPDIVEDPADRVTLDDSVRYALLIVLEQLSPAERTAWVLHDLFDLPFDDIAATVGRTPAAVRQLASRARRHVAASSPRVVTDSSEHDAVVAAFAAAAAGGDLGALVESLDPDVVLTSDGGSVVSAAHRPVHGPDRVARFVLGVMRKLPGIAGAAQVNGRTGLVVRDGERITAVVSLTVDGAKVSRVDVVLAPDKLGAAG